MATGARIRSHPSRRPRRAGSSEPDSKRAARASRRGEAPCQQPEMGNEKPGKLCRGGAIEVSVEASAATAPCKGPFDHPAFGQELEALDPRWPLDDLDCPRPTVGQCVS